MQNPALAIICGACSVPINPVLHPNADTEISCPQCGARDSFADVKAECMAEAKQRFSRAAKPISGSDDAPAFRWRYRDKDQ